MIATIDSRPSKDLLEMATRPSDDDVAGVGLGALGEHDVGTDELDGLRRVGQLTEVVLAELVEQLDALQQVHVTHGEHRTDNGGDVRLASVRAVASPPCRRTLARTPAARCGASWSPADRAAASAARSSSSGSVASVSSIDRSRVAAVGLRRRRAGRAGLGDRRRRSSSARRVVVGGGDHRSGVGPAPVWPWCPLDAAVVLVHDAARPLATQRAVRTGHRRGARRGRGRGARSVAVVDTIRDVDGGVVDRDRLRAVQTPQGFDGAGAAGGARGRARGAPTTPAWSRQRAARW